MSVAPTRTGRRLWTEPEIRELIESPHLSDEELAARLDRTVGAVSWERGLLCAFHRGANFSGLGTVSIRVSEQYRGKARCRCGQPI
jgi:hypothetical protein